MSVWKLHNKHRDRVFGVQLEATDNGGLSGTVNDQEATFQANGQWAASDSIPGRNYSAFSFSGRSGDPSPIFYSASGIMTGPGNNPTNIVISLLLARTGDGTSESWSGTLYPDANEDETAGAPQ